MKLAAAAKNVGNVGRSFARNPVRYTKQNKVPGAIGLFAVLVAIAFLRRGALPDQRGMIAVAAAAFVLAISATIAPDLVTWVLLVTIVVSLIQSRDQIADIVDLGTARVRGAFAAVAA